MIPHIGQKRLPKFRDWIKTQSQNKCEITNRPQKYDFVAGKHVNNLGPRTQKPRAESSEKRGGRQD